MEDKRLIINMDLVRQKISRRRLQKRRGSKNVWSMTATIKEENYELVLTEGDRTETDSVSKVVNRALVLMQRLMDSTQTDTFSAAMDSALHLVKHANLHTVKEPEKVLPQPNNNSQANSDFIDPDFMNVME
ncbi:hypothetical protein NWP18_03645 [Chrysosporum ovalisporum ANA283AFssAo]|nr:hypothetical protein [Umezakia ovalisporum]MDH6094267.1 hypothetical protein [Umezakia ovalisporum CobakiLakeB]MDH6101578.1 hypothetical protein [Umezakia ovalisporum ANA283AFssAo]